TPVAGDAVGCSGCAGRGRRPCDGQNVRNSGGVDSRFRVGRKSRNGDSCLTKAGRKGFISVKIAILGGTGKLGLAFAQRLLRTEHEVAIGSRDASNAAAAAKTLGDRVRGMTNAESASWCDLAI